MQIKTTVGCHFTPTMTTMSKTGNLRVNQGAWQLTIIAGRHKMPWPLWKQPGSSLRNSAHSHQGSQLFHSEVFTQMSPRQLSM